MDVLEENFKFYKDNKENLLAQYKNKYIVIFNKEVIGSYKDDFDAIKETKEKHDLGTFLVQHVQEKDPLLTFRSRTLLSNARSN